MKPILKTITLGHYKYLLISCVDHTDAAIDADSCKELLVKTFHDEYGWHVQNPQGKTLRQICTDYLQGLPSVCTVPFSNHDILMWKESVRGAPISVVTEAAHIEDYWRKVGMALAEIIEDNSNEN